MANGVQASYVEVDCDTGFIRILGQWAVDDCGRVINPLLVDEQVRGGIVQGIGAVLFEECVYSEDANLLNGTMVMLGGAGTIAGPLVGAILYIFLKEVVWVNFINFHTAILGIIIIAVIYVVPRGVLRLFQGPAWSKMSARLLRPSRADRAPWCRSAPLPACLPNPWAT